MIRFAHAFARNTALRRAFSRFLVLLFSLALASTASAQKKKKKDDASNAATAASLQQPEEQKIDIVIGEMLGAWQLGDVEKLHAHIADDVVVVNGMWAPPVIGWANYLAGYQSQRARAQQVRLERSNTLIRVSPSGNVAWASYQWEFNAVVDGAPSAAVGHTTLVFEKRNDHWMIVHNHTSLVQTSPVAAPAAQPTPTPAKP